MIDPDRDYLMTKVIQLNAELGRYMQAHEELSEANRRLTEANASALANAEGWKRKFEDEFATAEKYFTRYTDLARAAARDAGYKRTKSYLKMLGLPQD